MASGQTLLEQNACLTKGSEILKERQSTIQAGVTGQGTPVGACCWRRCPAAKAASAHQTHYPTASPDPAVTPAEHWKLPWQLPALPALLVLQIETLALTKLQGL